MKDVHREFLQESVLTFTRVDFFRIFREIFPAALISPHDLSLLCLELFPGRKMDRILPIKFFTQVLKLTYNTGRNDRRTTDLRQLQSKQRRTTGLFKKFAQISAQEDLRGHRHALQHKGDFEKLSHFRTKFQVDRDEQARTSAMAKINKAAINFSNAREDSLKGFKAGDMDSDEFKSQMNRAFNIAFTPKELTAVIEIFDLDGDGKISCAEFLSLFFRMKRAHEKQEKETIKAVEEEKARKIKIGEKKRAKKEEEIILEAIEPWDEEDLKSAVGAIAEKAYRWDAGKAGPAGLAGFQCSGLNPIEFREQLWRTFDLTFTKAELSALCETFDVDGDQTIDGGEFLSLFFRLRKKEQAFRHEQNKAKMLREKRGEEAKRVRNIIEEEKRMNRLVDGDFTQEDVKTAIEKIKSAKKQISSRTGAGPSVLDAFSKGPALTPAVLRNLCATHFLIYLTPKEVGALSHHFDNDGDGTIDGAEFMSGIMKFWSDADRVKREEQLVQDKKRREKHEELVKRREEKRMKELSHYALCKFTQEDSEAALRKIKIAAKNFDPRINTSLSAFQDAPMTPHEFRELLHRTFKITFNRKEISALVDFFDFDGEGTVEGSEFLSTFFILRREEQSAHIKLQNEEKKAREERAKKRLERKK